MEHTARLAVVEQNCRTPAEFEQLLDVLLELVDSILEEPRRRGVSVRGVAALERALSVAGTEGYLKHVGFVLENGNMTYPLERSLDELKVAKSAMERKFKFLGVDRRKSTGAKRKLTVASASKPPSLKPSSTPVLRTANEFLNTVRFMSDQVLKYEAEDAQESARRCVPLATLRARAVERLREQQKGIKRGSDGQEMPLEMALLAELVSWFKHSFFRWVDKPECAACGVATRFQRATSVDTGAEVCRVELFSCPRCSKGARFVRYNDPRQLLRTREGRCGEWANCFALVCRALGYDTRYVLDTTDHVWCEVYDPAERRWTHVDPCEAAVDTPLMYEHGWGKRIEYVLAFSRDDVQDVTWRYSSQHSEVRARRTKCSEAELIESLFALRAARQAPLSAARRRYLQQRTIRELAELMVERQPSDYEGKGRLSGSEEWRKERGEFGTETKHTWTFDAPGTHTVAYYPAKDKYVVSSGDTIKNGKKDGQGWKLGTWSCENIRWKLEKDWKMVYLARIDGGAAGRVAWRVAAGACARVASVSVLQQSATFENGRIEWSASADDGSPVPIAFQEEEGRQHARVGARCRSLTITATLSGGRGAASWQHAQLFRQPADARACGLRLSVARVN